MKTPVHHRLYLRIWLAVVGTVAVLALLTGWLARMEMERDRAERPGREIVLRNGSGDIVGQAPARPIRVPGQGPEFQVNMRDGSTLFIQLPRRGDRPPGAEPPMASNRSPLNFAWMLGIVAVAVALGTYPIVRRLTKRLEALDSGVRRWGDGDLSLRLPEGGQDEVAGLAQAFNAAAQRVQTLVQTHKTLLANASHELRSPLARIRMGLELLGPATQPGIRDEIARNIQELDQLIDEILLASRLDAREADLGTVEAVDLLGLAAEECARASARLVAPANGGAVLVQGVSRLLRRMLRNLLENARRHGAGAATVSLSAQAGVAVLTVHDHGPGVPAHLRERIFEPFYRLPGASEQDGGTGLGLALVKSIILRHGGSVQCRDHDGPGACFEVRLALDTAAHPG